MDAAGQEGGDIQTHLNSPNSTISISVSLDWLTRREESHRDVVANVLDCDIVVSGFKL